MDKKNITIVIFSIILVIALVIILSGVLGNGGIPESAEQNACESIGARCKTACNTTTELEVFTRKGNLGRCKFDELCCIIKRE